MYGNEVDPQKYILSLFSEVYPKYENEPITHLITELNLVVQSRSKTVPNSINFLKTCLFLILAS